MKETGTLEEVMEKVYDLYMKNTVTDFSLKRFLKKMGIFREAEILKLVETLKRGKEENDKL